MRIYKTRCRCAPATDFLEDLAVRHLRKPVPADFFRRGHSQHADPPETIDHVAWNVRLPIDLRRIEKFIEKVPKLFERCVKLRLFRRRDARIRHHPIGHEMPLKQTLGKPKRLWSRKKQLLGLLNFLLPFDVDLVHQKMSPPNGGETTHCSHATAPVQPAHRTFLRILKTKRDLRDTNALIFGTIFASVAGKAPDVRG